MRKTCSICIICAFICFLTTTAFAGSYDYKGTDVTDDVKNLEDGTFTLAYPNIDITSAKVWNDSENIIFSLTVKEIISPDNYTISYRFLIESLNTSERAGVFFTDYSYAFVHSGGNPSIECENTVNDNTLTITAPKTAFKNVTLPWNITAYADIYPLQGGANYEDWVTLENYTPPKPSQTPGFEMAAVVLALLVVIMLLKKQFCSR
ncbi:MAG: hypothetical protein NTV74_06555 [Euryarchaeota archaeon]|nr:hypothetical protein [Euryarchaeota archaeon]